MAFVRVERKSFADAASIDSSPESTCTRPSTTSRKATP